MVIKCIQLVKRMCLSWSKLFYLALNELLISNVGDQQWICPLSQIQQNDHVHLLPLSLIEERLQLKASILFVNVMTSNYSVKWELSRNTSHISHVLKWEPHPEKWQPLEVQFVKCVSLLSTYFLPVEI